MERRLVKLKMPPKPGERITIIWEQETKNGWTEHSIRCADTPHPDLANAMAGLTDTVLAICELQDSYAEKMRITGVTLCYGDSNGVTITAQCAVSAKSPLVLNTPLCMADDEEFGLSKDDMDALCSVEAQALAYVDGHRAQGDIEHMIKDWDADLKQQGATVTMHHAGETASIGAET